MIPRPSIPRYRNHRIFYRHQKEDLNKQFNLAVPIRIQFIQQKKLKERDTVIRRQLTTYKAKKAKSTSANESPETSSISQKTQISNPDHDIAQNIDHFTDLLVEG